MALPGIEKLKANIVVRAGSKAEFSLSPDEINSVLRDATVQAMGQPAQQMQITSVREQVVIILAAGGAMLFEDQSGDMPPRGDLATVVGRFIQLIGPKGITEFEAYGFNFDVLFDTKDDVPAAKTILDRYVVADRLSEHGITSLEGAGLRLYFTSGDARCDLRIEPQEQKRDSFRFFAHINFHYELPDHEFPTLDRIQSDFVGKWTMFEQVLGSLLIKQ